MFASGHIIRCARTAIIPFVPSHSAPPLNEDFRLVETLQAQRPGAVGHVYNVYGPELVEYAEGLLGDHERAVAAVRTALLALRDAEVPDAGAFRDWLYESVRDHCRPASAPRRRRAVVAAGVAAGVVALTAGMLALFESTDGRRTPAGAPPVAMTTPTAPAAPSPSRKATEPAVKEATKDEPEKSAEPEREAKAAGGRGRLSVDDGGCRGVRAAGLPRTCHIRLTATGGPVRWSVSSVRSRGGRISAGGAGTLAAGRSASVAVTVRPTVLCYMSGGGGGTVSFSPGGVATVSYTCWRR